MDKVKTSRCELIKISVNWERIPQPNPAFKRLMSLLLQEGKERKREVNDD